MANRVPSGLPASIGVTLDAPGLFVGATIWDDSGPTPVQVTGLAGMVGADDGVLPMLNWVGNSYRAQVTGSSGKWYLVQVSTYTDGTYETVSGNEPEGDDEIYFDPPPPSNEVSYPDTGAILAEIPNNDLDVRISDNGLDVQINSSNIEVNLSCEGG
jgi:hypothetical protein